jgi:hypothetical protein
VTANVARTCIDPREALLRTANLTGITSNAMEQSHTEIIPVPRPVVVERLETTTCIFVGNYDLSVSSDWNPLTSVEVLQVLNCTTVGHGAPLSSHRAGAILLRARAAHICGIDLQLVSIVFGANSDG